MYSGVPTLDMASCVWSEKARPRPRSPILIRPCVARKMFAWVGLGLGLGLGLGSGLGLGLGLGLGQGSGSGSGLPA